MTQKIDLREQKRLAYLASLSNEQVQALIQKSIAMRQYFPHERGCQHGIIIQAKEVWIRVDAEGNLRSPDWENGIAKRVDQVTFCNNPSCLRVLNFTHGGVLYRREGNEFHAEEKSAA